MASTTEKPADPEYRSEAAAAPTPPPAGLWDYFQADVALRFLLFASSLVAIVVIVTSQQTELAPAQPLGGPPLVPKPAKFKYSPAYIYFVTAFSVAGLYSILTTLASISVMSRPDLKLKFLLHFIFWDTLILGIVASATGTAGAVAYSSLKGNDHFNWNEVCNVYDKFCRHLAGSLAVALFGSVVAVLLVWLSATSLHSRIPK
ncbi:CASP-like protein 1D2 [Prosopis cineraria]|uniref:CASP-like protein 1D2 n=1 Tax=Prosopis cineraria TaxID=364024 RepID=UPI002410851F|nr:CASP-like protein 1D2 [Prosopis cineraria]